MAARVVDDIRKRVDARIAELEPMIAEYQELLAVKQGLGGGSAPRGSAAKPAARRGTTRRASAGSRPRAKRGASKPGRAEQALELIGKTPGITVKDIAKHMKINDNYLYRLLPRMEKEGKLKRQGGGWAIK